MRYQESVPAARWFVWPLAALGVLLVFAGVWTLVRAEDGDRWAGAVMLPVGAVLLVVARIFGTLRIEVDHATLRVRYGPIGPTLRYGEVRAARVEPYRWLAYGGWGLRFAWPWLGRRIAYSVPFLRTGVEIETVSGTRYYVTTRRPRELAEAVKRLAKESA